MTPDDVRDLLRNTVLDEDPVALDAVPVHIPGDKVVIDVVQEADDLPGAGILAEVFCDPPHDARRGVAVRNVRRRRHVAPEQGQCRVSLHGERVVRRRDKRAGLMHRHKRMEGFTWYPALSKPRSGLFLATSDETGAGPGYSPGPPCPVERQPGSGPFPWSGPERTSLLRAGHSYVLLRQPVLPDPVPYR